jgi:hypothetical protein
VKTPNPTLSGYCSLWVARVCTYKTAFIFDWYEEGHGEWLVMCSGSVTAVIPCSGPGGVQGRLLVISYLPTRWALRTQAWYPQVCTYSYQRPAVLHRPLSACSSSADQSSPYQCWFHLSQPARRADLDRKVSVALGSPTAVPMLCGVTRNASSIFMDKEYAELPVRSKQRAELCCPKCWWNFTWLDGVTHIS